MNSKVNAAFYDMGNNRNSDSAVQRPRNKAMFHSVSKKAEDSVRCCMLQLQVKHFKPVSLVYSRPEAGSRDVALPICTYSSSFALL